MQHLANRCLTMRYLTLQARALMQSHDIEAMLLSPSKAEAMVQVRLGLGSGVGVGVGSGLGSGLGLGLGLLSGS